MKRAGVMWALYMVLLLTGCAGLNLPLQNETVSGSVSEEETMLRETVEESDSTQQLSVPAETGYAYQTLTDDMDRTLYMEILYSLWNREEETVLSGQDESKIKRIFDCVMADHPEIFYADGYHTRIYKMGEQVERIVFTGTYTVNAEQTDELALQIKEQASLWLEAIPGTWDDYSKAKYLYEMIIERTEYDAKADNGQNIRSVFLQGRSVCQGYAKAYQYLCRQTGIECVTVSGSANGQGHAWTILKLDGEWYHTDPTWGDAVYLLEEDSEPARSSMAEVNFDYFCVTTEEIQRTHQLSDTICWPDCTAVSNQYYRKEGLWLETADLEEVQKILESGRAQGADHVTFQCADDMVYAQVFGLLIEQQKIFELLESNRISYADSPLHRTLTFWF